MEKDEAIRNTEDFEEILDIQYGKVGTDVREQFEENAQFFIAQEISHLTQISENAKPFVDINQIINEP